MYVKREVSWPAVLVVSAAVAVIALCGYLLATWPPDPPDAPQSAPVAQQTTVAQTEPLETASPSPTTQADGKVLAVLGDSFSAESEASTGPEWPQILQDDLGWKVLTNADDGSGYVSAGAGEPFGDRVAAVLKRSPDVIIVAGGVGDVGAHPTEQVVAAADDVVGRLVEKAPEAKVVLVSPFSSGAPGPLTAEVSSGLEQVAKTHDVPYVDATGWLADSGKYFGADPDHPSDKGQGQLARRMEQALTRLGIADTAGSSSD